MEPAYGDIARLLDRARRRRGWVIALAASGFGVAAGSAAVLAGAAAVALGARTGSARLPALLLAAAALAAAAAWGARAFRRGARTPEGAARTVAAGSPALRSDLVSAVELFRARPALLASGAVSVALVDAHLERTAAAAKGIDLAAAIPSLPARRAGLVLAAAAAVHLAAFAVGGRALARGYGRVVGGDPVAAVGPSLDPITGDIELSYRYPAHTRRPPQSLSGTGGEIRAPRGTIVTLRTRADRPVEAAELELTLAGESPVVGEGAAQSLPPGAPGAGPPGPAVPPAEPRAGEPPAPALRRVALEVAGGRELSGTFTVDDGGSYRFRFTGPRGRLLAEGPPIPVVLEPDAFPVVRVTAPGQEIEVRAEDTVRVEWQAEDDHGLDRLELVTRGPGGVERRRAVPLLAGARRDAGGLELPLAAERLSEGDRLLYWLEAVDNDAVSGPKRGASATQVVKIYSEAEHRRLAMEKARAAWEELLALLGDRLELFDQGPVATPARLPLAVALDGRARALAERLLAVAAELRREKAAPKDVPRALVNVGRGLRAAEQRVTAMRQAVARLLSSGTRVDAATSAPMDASDRLLDRELEKGVLYLEQLFDKARAEDLVRMAQDLSRRRGELADALQRFREAPSDKARQELLARIQRMKEQMAELMARMAETARGFNDQHMNAEALAELSREKDALAGLDDAEEALRRGDVEAAMKALDAMGSRLDQLLAGMRRTGEVPDERQRELMEEMLAFKDRLERVEAEQGKVAEETRRLRDEARRRDAPRREQARARAEALRQLAEEARRELQQAGPAAPVRAEADLEVAQEATKDLERALRLRDVDAATEMAMRALPSASRLAMALEEDASMAERLPGSTGEPPEALREAQRHAREGVGKLSQIASELRQLAPDTRQSLTPAERERLSELARRQQGLEREAADLQARLGQLMQRAPVFPESAPGLLGESRGHMQQAGGELQGGNPQRGHGEQQAALDALGRFKKGLEEMAQRGGSGGGGFPFPFGEQGGEARDGDMGDPSREKVEIPGAEAHRAPEEFRRDLLEAMKQGAPERYKGEVQRYYEEIVK